MLCALIMAGGKGTRLWPKSTQKLPKQFLNIVNEKTMLQSTYDRIRKVIQEDRIFVVTAKEYKELVKEQLPEIEYENIIIEPDRKNTTLCILLSNLYINQKYGNAPLAVFHQIIT